LQSSRLRCAVAFGGLKGALPGGIRRLSREARRKSKGEAMTITVEHVMIGGLGLIVALFLIAAVLAWIG
jgi:hypothetical protein